MDKKYFINVINKLEGYKTRLKELHWSSPSRSFHVIIDEFSEEIANFEDAFVENSITLVGFVYAGDLNPILPKEMDFETNLGAIRGLLSSIKDECTDQMWSGVINLVDDFWSVVGKYIYLAKITNHEA